MEIVPRTKLQGDDDDDDDDAEAGKIKPKILLVLFVSENTDAKQSSLNTEMENQIEAVSDKIVLDIHRVSDNVNELMETLRRWKAKENLAADCNEDEFSQYARRIDQKLDRELNRFFNMRRVFAEYREEDVTSEHELFLPKTARIETSAGRHARDIYIRMRSTWKQYCTWKPKKKVKLAKETIEEQGEEDMDKDVDNTIASMSPVPLELVGVDQEDKDVTPEEPMEADLVTADMDATPGTSQDQFQGEHVDQTDISATSGSPSKDTETKPNVSASFRQDISDTAETDRRLASRQSDFKNGRQAGRRSSVVYKEMKSVWKRVFRNKKNVVHSSPHQRDEVAAQSDSQGTLRSPAPQEASTLTSVCCSDDIGTATESHLSPVPLKLVDVKQEDEDVTPEQPMEEDLVKADMDATPGTSQDQFQGEHVDQADISATSGSSSKDTETKPNVSTSFRQDISDTAEADRRLASRQSDFKNGRQAGRRGSVVYKEMKSVWKRVFRNKKNVVHSSPHQRDEVAAQSDSQGTLRSPAPQEASTLTSVCCSDDIGTATESHLSPVPLKLVDVKQEDEDVTPEEPMEADLVTADMDATPGTSQDQFQGEHVDQADISATSGSPSKDTETKPNVSASFCQDISDTAEADRRLASRQSDFKNGRQAGRRSSVVYKEMKSVWKRVFRNKKNVVHSSPHQRDEVAAQSDSQGTLRSPAPQEASTLTSVCCSDDIGTATESHLSPVPLELVDVKQEKEDVTPEQPMEEDLVMADMDATPGTSQDQFEGEYVDQADISATSGSPSKDTETKPNVSASFRQDQFQGEHVNGEDLIMDNDSIPGPSDRDRHPKTSQEGSGAAAHVTDLKYIFYYIISQFFNSFTEKELKEMRRGVYNTQVKEHMVDMSTEVLKCITEAVTNTVSQVITQFAHEHGTTISATCSQEHNTEQVDQNPSAELLRESFHITDDDIQSNVKRSFDEALSAVLNLKGVMSPKFHKTVTNELNSVLSETIQASLEEGSSTCCQFSCCRRCKEVLMGIVRAIRSCTDISSSEEPKKKRKYWSYRRWWTSSPQVASTSRDPSEKMPAHEDKDTTPEIREAQPPKFTGCFPSATDKDTATVPDYQQSPSVAKRQCSDSGAGKSNRFSQNSCESSKKDKEKKISDDTTRKKPSLLHRIRLFFSHGTRNDVQRIPSLGCLVSPVLFSEKRLEPDGDCSKDEAAGLTPSPSKNTDAKQSSLNTEMENQIEAVSDKIVLDIHRVSDNVNELMETLRRWKAKENLAADCNEDEFSQYARRIDQKLDRELNRFFNMRRVFAEYREEDVTSEHELFLPKTARIETSAGRHARDIYIRMRSTWKQYCTWKPKKKVKLAKETIEEQGEEDMDKDVDNTIASMSPVPLELVGVDQEDKDVTPEEPMEADLVTADMDATPGTSQDQFQGEHVDQTDISATSGSPSKDTETKPNVSASFRQDISDTAETDRRLASRQSDFKNGRQAGRRSSVVYKEMKSVWKRVFRNKKNVVHSSPHQRDEVAAQSDSQGTLRSPAPQEASTLTSVCCSDDIGTATESHLSPVPLKLVDVKQEDEDVTPEEPMEADLVTADMDATPGTSQDQFQGEHVDQADISATSGSPSKDTETKPNVSASFCQGISDTAEADRRLASRQSDFKNGRQAGRRSSVVYKQMKSVWKRVFRNKKNVVHSSPHQRDEVAAQSDSQGTLRSPAPQEASTLTSVCCSDDIGTATESHLSPVPLKLVDVKQEDEDVTPEQPMEEELVKADMDATSGTSQDQFQGEHVDQADISATSGSPSKDTETKPNVSASFCQDISDTAEADRRLASRQSDFKNGRQAGRRSSVVYKEMKSVWKRVFRNKKNVVHSSPHQRDEVAAQSDSQGTLRSPAPQEASTLTSVCCSDDIGTATESHLSPVPLELVDVKQEKEDVTPEQPMEEDLVMADIDATPGTSQDQFEGEYVGPANISATSGSPSKDTETKPNVSASFRQDRFQGEHVNGEDLIMDNDSIPGPSDRDRHPKTSQEGSGAAAHVTDLKYIFYYIISQFFNSFTEKELKEMRRGVYNTQVKEHMVDMSTEVLKCITEAVTNTVSQVISQFAHEHGTTISATCSQEHNTEQVDQNPSAELLRESFHITDDDIQSNVKRSFDEALSAVLNLKGVMSPKFHKTVTNELNSVLSETIQASLEEGSSTCCQFSCCRRCKEVLMGIVRAIKSCTDISSSEEPKKKRKYWSYRRWWTSSPQVASTSRDPSEKMPAHEDKDTTPEIREAQPPKFTGCFPSATDKDTATVPDYQQSPSVAKRQCSDSGAGKSNRFSQNSCESSKKDKEKKISDDTTRKKPSLLHRIRLFFSHEAKHPPGDLKRIISICRCCDSRHTLSVTEQQQQREPP
ncbi:hypothetical protein PAMA_015669 [Pampus argenteus]